MNRVLRALEKLNVRDFLNRKGPARGHSLGLSLLVAVSGVPVFPDVFPLFPAVLASFLLVLPLPLALALALPLPRSLPLALALALPLPLRARLCGPWSALKTRAAQRLLRELPDV